MEKSAAGYADSGKTMKWNPDLYATRHSFIFESGREALAILAPRKGERILDLGCGTGQLTHAIAESGALVTGLDSSADMLEAARRRYPDLPFVLADAANFTFPEPFDAVFSNAALHWMNPPDEVVACIVRSLREGGRFAAQFAGKGHIATLRRAIDQAFLEIAGSEPSWNIYLPSVAEFCALLERFGLEVREARLSDAFTKLEEGEAGLRNFLAMFGGDRLRAIPEALREKLLRRTEELARPSLFRGGNWHVDRRRLFILAVKSLA